ncbi:MAG: Ig-like domain-containing protein [Clostridiales bacterium]|jgi:uncharacterized protein YjdB/pimeloyl-ACP methyl ester carboxylesterase|nr:Ig-like domain-containing protein [Clostridiales bacterium]
MRNIAKTLLSLTLAITLVLPSIVVTDAASKDIDIVFVIDSTPAMSKFKNLFYSEFQDFSANLEAYGIKPRFGVVEFHDVTRDTWLSTKPHIGSYGSFWHKTSEQVIKTLKSLPIYGGGSGKNTPIDALGYLTNDNANGYKWNRTAEKFAVLMTNSDYKTNNRHGYRDLTSISLALKSDNLTTSVITNESLYDTYQKITSMTKGLSLDINGDFKETLQRLSDHIIEKAGVKKTGKKAIYVLPGYLGSQLYTSNGGAIWGDMNMFVIDILNYAATLRSKVRNDSNGENMEARVNMGMDRYGYDDVYKNMVEYLEKNFSNKYDVVFFPYNWLGDLNDSAKSLYDHIDKMGYDKVVFVTHSTGGLLASAYIGLGEEARNKVEKAALVAPPLFGAYSALEPLEFGQNRTVQEVINQYSLPGVIQRLVFSYIKSVTKNSPTTYQLLPSEEYLASEPMIFAWRGAVSKPIVTSEGYYNLLNLSANINPRLTNGGARSHESFRESSLNGDVTKLWGGDAAENLEGVDAVIIGTSSGFLTPTNVSYKIDRNGAVKVSDIKMTLNGDGTVAGISAFGVSQNGTIPFKDFKDYGLDHLRLAQEKPSLDFIRDFIENRAKGDVYEIETAHSDMSELIKITFSANDEVDIKLYDDSGDIAAHASKDEVNGFDDGQMKFTAIEWSDEQSVGTLYAPANGYRVVIASGDKENAPVDFEGVVSSMDENGDYVKSVTVTEKATGSNGALLDIDFTRTSINSANIEDFAQGETQVFETEWDVESVVEAYVGETIDIPLTGVLSLDELSAASSDEDVVIVTADKRLYISGAGEAAIALTDGNKTASLKVSALLETPEIEIDDIFMQLGETAPVNAWFNPEWAIDKTLSYSYDDSVARVDENGAVTALKSGETSVTAYNAYGASTTFNVFVEGAEPVIEVTPSESQLTVGKSVTLTADVSENAGVIRWGVEDPSVASISPSGYKCLVTAKKTGETKVIAISPGTGVSAEAVIKVAKIPVKGVTLSAPSIASMRRGTSAKVTAKISPSNATNRDVTWKSYDTNVATVQNGVITAKRIGITTISAVTNDGGHRAAFVIIIL